MRLSFLIILVFCSGNPSSAQQLVLAPVASKNQVKQLISEKKIEEAILLLQNEPKKIIKNQKDQIEIAQWLSAFQYENTLNFYEKSLEAWTTEPEVAEKNFLEALKAEPNNKTVLMARLSFLISQQRNEEANKLLVEIQLKQPYLMVFMIYRTYLNSLSKQKQGKFLDCENMALEKIEHDFCEYVKLAEKITTSVASRPGKDILQLLRKTQIPNKHELMWKRWGQDEQKKSYLSSCQGLSDKDKKNYKIVPNLCQIEEKEPRE